MHPALKAMLHDPIQIAPYTSTDAYGKVTYGPPVTYLGRLEKRYQTMPGSTGAMLHDFTVVFLAEDAVVDMRSQVTIDGRIVSLQGVKSLQDADGNMDHYQLYL